MMMMMYSSDGVVILCCFVEREMCVCVRGSYVLFWLAGAMLLWLLPFFFRGKKTCVHARVYAGVSVGFQARCASVSGNDDDDDDGDHE